MVDALVRPLARADLAAAQRVLDRALGGREQVRLGERVDVLALPGTGAWIAQALVGVAFHTLDGDRAELTAIAVLSRHRARRVGARLLEAAATAAGSAGAAELWLVTTNDNLDALRLYQRHGFRVTEVHAGAVDEARRLKPTIPLVGSYGIEVHDELVLTRAVSCPRGHPEP